MRGAEPEHPVRRPDFVIACDDPRRADVRALIARHLAFAHAHSPPEDVHALEVDALTEPGISFFSARGNDDEILAVGALKMLDRHHAELKSMHTVEQGRGAGIGEAMLRSLLGVARSRGVQRVSLETGTADAFAPARRLYARAGFVRCEPFGEYVHSPNSLCMTLVLT